jgi:hypothetical protein
MRHNKLNDVNLNIIMFLTVAAIKTACTTRVPGQVSMTDFSVLLLLLLTPLLLLLLLCMQSLCGRSLQLWLPATLLSSRCACFDVCCFAWQLCAGMHAASH